MKVKAVILGIMIWGLALTSQAMETSQQMGLTIKTSRNLADNLDMTAKMFFINLMNNHAPYAEVGIKYKIDQHFSSKAVVGYGFENIEQDHGAFYGLYLNWHNENFNMQNSVFYFHGLDILFANIQADYSFKLFNLGLETRNYQWYRAEDQHKRSYQFGPFILLKYSENMKLKFNAFYAYEPFGNQNLGVEQADQLVYKATVILNF